MNSLGQEPKFCIMHEKSVSQLSRLRTYQNVVFILIHFFTVLSETTTSNDQTVESCFTGPSNVLLQRFSEKKKISKSNSVFLDFLMNCKIYVIRESISTVLSDCWKTKSTWRDFNLSESLYFLAFTSPLTSHPSGLFSYYRFFVIICSNIISPKQLDILQMNTNRKHVSNDNVYDSRDMYIFFYRIAIVIIFSQYTADENKQETYIKQ